MIEFSQQNGIIELCINRPEKRNALSHEMYHELARLLDVAQVDSSCSAVILHGAHGRFTAGADIKDFQTKRGYDDPPAVTFLRKLHEVDVPLIAAVEDIAIGIGSTMLQHFDFVYTTPQTRFRMPFVQLGLCPEGGSSYLLEKIVGTRKARDWLLTCRVFDGQEAFDAGFVSELVPAGETLARARQVALELTKMPKASLRLAKRMLKRQGDQSVTDALDHELRMFADQLNTDETQRIFAAFLAKA